LRGASTRFCLQKALGVGLPDHLREAPCAGALFIVLSGAAVALAGLLAVCNHRLAWGGAGALSSMAVLAYIISRAVGLPSLGDDLGDWLNPLGVAALACETAAVVICCLTLFQRA
jgi:hypothetical protein